MTKQIKQFVITLSLLLSLTASYSQNLVINEIMTSNSSVNTDEDETYQDWVEIYNSGSESINLEGFGLSDDKNLLSKWTFPNVSIAAGQYLLVWCSDKNRINPSLPLHTNFKLSSEGETISLSNASGTIVDQLQPIVIPANFSYGKISNDTYSFFQNPTPGSENTSQDFSEILSEPIFSVSSGFFNAPFSLSISNPDPNATIIYTLDGSEPSYTNLNGTTYYYKDAYQQYPENAPGQFKESHFTTLPYENPITITDRTAEPNKVSMIPTSYFTYQYYLPTTPIFKGTVVRAKVIKGGALSSKTITQNYYVTPAAANAFSVPVVAINVDENLFFDYEDGIYVPGKDFDNWRTENPLLNAYNPGVTYPSANYNRSGDTAEVKANFSYYVNGTETVNQDVGIRINGASSRDFPNKSLRLYARPEYGNEAFEYSFFSDISDSSFKTLLLRNSGSDANSTYFRDAFIQKTVAHLKFDTQNYQPTVTFLNGEYWGLLNLRERYDKHYFKQVYNIEENQLDFLENNSVKEGDDHHYTAMLNFIENNSLSNDQNYSYIKTQLDTENFIDYFSSEVYIGNTDWPHNNIEFFRKKTIGYEPNAPYGQDGRWRWVMKDTDLSFGLYQDITAYQDNTLAFATSLGEAPEWSTLLIRKLLENNDFKNDFINRFADLMNTTFIPQRVTGIIDEMKSGIANEIGAHRQRWNDGTLDDWNAAIQTMETFAQERPAFQRDHIRQKFSIESNIDATLNVSNSSEGFIQINTIKIKDGTPGITGNPYPWTGVYFKNIPVKLKAVAYPGYKFSHWSGDSNSTNEEIIINPDSNINVTANFTAQEESLDRKTIYFWLLDNNLVNDAPIQSILPTFSLGNAGILEFDSCLDGYPFVKNNPNWRKASMERRNSPTDINYRPEVNNDIPFANTTMRGIQIKQPFQNNGKENALRFNFSTTGFQKIKFDFTAKDEGAADVIKVDYALDSTNPTWITT
ncbi:MAG: CotH kinase family protein, partial [Flavobacterium sp.]